MKHIRQHDENPQSWLTFARGIRGFTLGIMAGGMGLIASTVAANDASFQSIAAGNWHTVAIQADGSLWAWGRNDVGQLGIGPTADQSSPVQVGTGQNWRAVAAGDQHTVAVKTDGTLWAWGYNGWGQLGIGSYTTTNQPVQVGTDQDWRSVAAGGDHTVALKTDGSLWTWGWNQFGQVGNGTTKTQYSPTPIWPAQLPKFTSITRQPNGQILLNVEGPTNVVYRVLESTNLLNWHKIGSLTNATGSASWQDTTAPNLHRRFYRLKQQP